MQRLAVSPTLFARTAPALGPWLTRRWYYTPKTHRSYSVRQISPGDRRLLAEFALTLSQSAPQRDHADLRELERLLFDRVLGAMNDEAGFVALENTVAGDRVIGLSAYAPTGRGTAVFRVAVANSFRDEQVGRNLLATLVRHAKRVGIARLEAEMLWSNRAMQVLAMSMGFAVEPVPQDRTRRRLVLQLK
jgi:RimJ/RimL family protein N-acetyltransferase